MTAAAKRLALDQDRCIQILRECGFFPTGPIGLMNLGQIPDGLNAEELERFLRENGAETSGLRGTKLHDGWDHVAHAPGPTSRTEQRVRWMK